MHLIKLIHAFMGLMILRVWFARLMGYRNGLLVEQVHGIWWGMRSPADRKPVDP